MLTMCECNEIRLTRGDDADFIVNITNDVNGLPYSIATNDTIRLTVKRNIRSSAVSISKTVVGSNAIHISPSDTSNLDFGLYKYDLQLTTNDGRIYTIIPFSNFIILPEVT